MAWIDVLLTSHTIKKLYRHRFRKLRLEYDLTQVELDVLLFLANHPKRDTAKEIAELRGLSKSQVSQAVDKLTSKGYLHAEVDQEDRRWAHLTLRPSAQPVCQRTQAQQQVIFEELLDGITPESRKQFRDTLVQIIINADKGLQNVE